MKILTALKSKQGESGGSGKANEKLLNSVVIAAPCPLSWESMVGDDKVRHCGGCSKNVYNLSAMTDKEAESFLQVNGATQCMRFYRRADGTIMTDNCPVGLRKIRDRVRNIGRLAAGFVALILAFPSASAQSGETKMLRGKPSINSTPTTIFQPRIPGYLSGGAMPLRPVDQQPAYMGGDVDVPELPTARPVIMGEPPLQINIAPTKTVKTPKKDPTSKNPDGGYYKLYAQFNRYADETALNHYKKAKEMEKKSNFDMAEFYYEKALEEIDNQEKKNGNAGHDPAFRKLIEGQIKDLQEKSKPRSAARPD